MLSADPEVDIVPMVIKPLKLRQLRYNTYDTTNKAAT